ncbi:MAG: antitoxin [Thermoanaerobaculia bacterium]
MRTTVTLDEDVELPRAAKERSRESFKQVLNAAVRRGLKGQGGEVEEPFVVRARPLGLVPGVDPARIRELDDELEIQEFLRKTRALEAREDDRP